jgi:phosphoglycolate phosphatase
MRLLFDLDGTLTDPFVGITKCIQYALKTLGREVPAADELRWCIGPPLHESFLSLLKSSDDRLASEALRIYRERFGTVGLFENEIYSGIEVCLQELSQKGYTLSIATSKPTVFATRIVEHFKLAEYFCEVDGSELDGTRSDKTSLIRHILERDQLDPTDVIMIGDRKHDMIGAKNNQVVGIGVLWGYGSIDELEAAGASLCIIARSELVNAIARAENRGIS